MQSLERQAQSPRSPLQPLVAAALGMIAVLALVDALSPVVAAAVAHEITKDLSRLRQDELENRIASW